MNHTNAFQFTKFIFVTVFAIALSLTFLFSGCTQIQEPKTIRVGLNDWPGYWMAEYAKENKLFEKRGLKVDLVHFNNQQDNIRATIRGAQDLSFVTIWELMQVDPKNDKPVVILVSDISSGSDGIVARAGIQSIKDLKGKKIGAKLGTVPHLILLEALKSQQMKPKDIEILDVSNQRASELLKAQKVDAAVMWEPLLGETAVETGGKVIFTTKDVDSLVIDALVTGSNGVATNKDSLTKFILAWFDAIHDVETDPDKVFGVLAKHIKQPKENVAKNYSGLKKGDIALNQRMFTSNGRLVEAIQEATKLLREDRRHGKVIRYDVEINSEPLLDAIKNWKP